jgi:hypothetical protein
MSSTLKVVILYDARNNTYTVCDHNLTPKEAEKQIAEWRTKLLPAIGVDQRQRHVTPNPQVCKTCRRDVGRASGLTPKPRFKRRHNA